MDWINILEVIAIVIRRVVEAIQKGDDIVQIDIRELRIDRTADDALDDLDK